MHAIIEADELSPVLVYLRSFDSELLQGVVLVTEPDSPMMGSDYLVSNMKIVTVLRNSPKITDWSKKELYPLLKREVILLIADFSSYFKSIYVPTKNEGRVSDKLRYSHDNLASYSSALSIFRDGDITVNDILKQRGSLLNGTCLGLLRPKNRATLRRLKDRENLRTFKKRRKGHHPTGVTLDNKVTLSTLYKNIPVQDMAGKPDNWPERYEGLIRTFGEAFALSGKKSADTGMGYAEWRTEGPGVSAITSCDHGNKIQCYCKQAVSSRYQKWLDCVEGVIKLTEGGEYIQSASWDVSPRLPKTPTWPETYLGRLQTDSEANALMGRKKRSEPNLPPLDYLRWRKTVAKNMIAIPGHTPGCLCRSCATVRYETWWGPLMSPLI